MTRVMLRDVLIDSPERPLATFVLAHGAGSAMDAPIMNDLTAALCAGGIELVRFEFPYMHRLRHEGKRGPPDRMPVLNAAYAALVAELGPRPRLFIGGRSMGGRVATHVADSLGVQGVIALGYPFHPPKKPESLRIAHLLEMKTPCLIVQGTRDPFGTPAEVEGYGLPSSISVCWLEDGDHSFAPRKARGRTLADNLQQACDRLLLFMSAQPRLQTQSAASST